MRLALMQPYLFPYIGYFQLLESVDTFVVYDDVAFIKQGWINRNNLLLAGKPFLFTIPLLNASSFSLIKDTQVSYKQPWAGKLLKTIAGAYRKAPFYSEVFPLIEGVLASEAVSIGALATQSIQAVATYMGIDTEIKEHSGNYNNQQLSGQNRVLDICKQEGATVYHNTIGGQELYSKGDFAKEGIELSFVKTPLVPYTQFKEPFVSGLSIIDVLMFNSPEDSLKFVQDYSLV